MSDIEARREAVDIARVVLIAALICSFGAILISASIGYFFGALPAIEEKSAAEPTDSRNAVLIEYDWLSRQAIGYIYLGIGLLIGGILYGLFFLRRIKGQIPSPVGKE